MYKGVGHQSSFRATYTPHVSDTDSLYVSSSGGNGGTDTAYTAPTNKYPVKVALNLSQGEKNVINNSCRDVDAGVLMLKTI